MKIPVTEGHNTLFLPVENILRMESIRVYTIFHVKDGKQYVVSKHIGEIEKQLKPGVFFRVHKQHIINLREVATIKNARSPLITMSDNVVINVAIRRKAELIRMLKKLK
jgi:two-component system LytT family response regulator